MGLLDTLMRSVKITLLALVLLFGLLILFLFGVVVWIEGALHDNDAMAAIGFIIAFIAVGMFLWMKNKGKENQKMENIKKKAYYEEKGKLEADAERKP